jgi:hypothetical protein
MFSSSYTPKFPYAGDQVIVSSGRLIFHAKDDTAFIFASKAVSLSTSGSTHINSPEGIYMNGNRIELGLNAQESVLKGDMVVNSLKVLYKKLDDFVVAVGGLSETNLAEAIPLIHTTAGNLSTEVKLQIQRLPDLLSQTTKTL